MNSNNMIVALITGLAALLTTPSTEADRIVKLKADLGKTLEDLKADEALSNITASFANAATAANPPSREDVTSASRLGEVKAPKPQAPEEQPSESPEGSPPVPLSDPTFKEGPGDEEEPQE